MEVQEIIDFEINLLLKKYKTDRAYIYKKFELEFSKRDDIKKLVFENKDIKRLYKNKILKEFIKKLRKKVYFDLRNYYGGEDKKKEKKLSKLVHDLANSKDSKNKTLDQILKIHTSTRERLEYIDSFNEQIFKFIAHSKTILDIGGGIYPLMFNFEAFNLNKYFLIEKDKKAAEIVKTFKSSYEIEGLNVENKIVEKVDFKMLGFSQANKADVAFMFKFITVASRRDRRIQDVLAKIPAKLFIITSPTEALIRKQSIKSREKKELLSFTKLLGGEIVGEINIPNEFGFVVKK